MIQHRSSSKYVTQQAALRRRLKGFYRRYNQGDWNRCYLHLDPKLRAAGRVDPEPYVRSLQTFQRHYGAIDIWYIRISVYFDVRNNKHDDRPLAYAYVFWQDEHKAFHVFCERWVYDCGRWYTRVVGLVPHTGSG